MASGSIDSGWNTKQCLSLPCKTKAERKEFTDDASCPIVPDEATKQKIKLRHHVGIFRGDKRRDYSKWRNRLLSHLERLGLTFTLQRTPPEEPCPAGLDQVEREAWYQTRCEHDCDAIEEFCMSVEGEALEKIGHCTYAKEVLNALDECYLKSVHWKHQGNRKVK
ncbi:uncharacterized protein LOC134218423 [Armigeres subalbatus]|uniref:uncharacterized protein LOC134218423 n=1 Tax=Armigeres subalbatus TaxID=124917 RepID=UPI002ECFC350